MLGRSALHDDPRVFYAAEDAETCALIDFVCPDGAEYFGGGECGCGCILDMDCDPDRFDGTSGLAEPFGLYASCEFLVVCSDGALAPLQRVVTGEFGRAASCREGGDIACREASSVCVIAVADVDERELAAACAVSLVPERVVSRMVCGGDR